VLKFNLIVTLWIVFVIGTRPIQSGVPDVANAAAVLTSKVSAEGGSVGRRVLASRHYIPPLKSSGDPTKKCTNENDDAFDGNEMRIAKLIQFNDENELLWSIELHDNSLYVELPEHLCEGSKEKFVSLLEFADDTLHCKHVFVYFDKTRIDRAALVKTFMFLGFHILAPKNTLMTSFEKHSDNHLFMVYAIDNDG